MNNKKKKIIIISSIIGLLVIGIIIALIIILSHNNKDKTNNKPIDNDKNYTYNPQEKYPDIYKKYPNIKWTTSNSNSIYKVLLWIDSDGNGVYTTECPIFCEEITNIANENSIFPLKVSGSLPEKSIYALMSNNSLYHLYYNNKEVHSELLFNDCIDITKLASNYRKNSTNFYIDWKTLESEKDIYFLTKNGDLIDEHNYTYEQNNKNFDFVQCFNTYSENLCLYFDKNQHISYRYIKNINDNSEYQKEYNTIKDKNNNDIVAKYLYDNFEENENGYIRKTIIIDENNNLYTIEHNENTNIEYYGQIESINYINKNSIFQMNDGKKYEFYMLIDSYFDVKNKTELKIDFEKESTNFDINADYSEIYNKIKLKYPSLKWSGTKYGFEDVFDETIAIENGKLKHCLSDYCKIIDMDETPIKVIYDGITSVNNLYVITNKGNVYTFNHDNKYKLVKILNNYSIIDMTEPINMLFTTINSRPHFETYFLTYDGKLLTANGFEYNEVYPNYIIGSIISNSSDSELYYDKEHHLYYENHIYMDENKKYTDNILKYIYAPITDLYGNSIQVNSFYSIIDINDAKYAIIDTNNNLYLLDKNFKIIESEFSNKTVNQTIIDRGKGTDGFDSVTILFNDNTEFKLSTELGYENGNFIEEAIYYGM